MKKAPIERPPYPPAPEHLSERAKELWRQLGPEHAREIGRQLLLAAALESLDRADEARKKVATDGIVSTTPRSGALHVHPCLKVEAESRKMLSKLFFQLGIDQVPHSVWG